MSDKQIRESTVEIVKAYIARNSLSVRELQRLMRLVYGTLSELERSAAKGEEKGPAPAVTVSKSVSRHRIVCLEDGKTFKTLKRHLRTAHGLSPEEYRAKWGLEGHYPMVAPAYSKRRAQLAVKIGLGRFGRGRPASPRTAKGQLTDAA